jgi:hypothetical protein
MTDAKVYEIEFRKMTFGPEWCLEYVADTSKEGAKQQFLNDVEVEGEIIPGSIEIREYR